MSAASSTPSPIAIPMAAPARSSRRETISRLLRTPTFLIAAFVIGFWTFCAIFGYHIAPHDPTFQTTDILQSPNGKYPFGTDQIGQDVLSRVIAGSRSTMEIAPAATLIATTAGTAIGLMLGYFRGWFDEIVGRLIDAFLAIPGIIFLIAVITSLGSSVRTLIITIGIAFTPIIARTVRAAVLAEAGLDYVQAAKLRGEKAPYILFAEILPNIVPPIIVEATVRLGYAIFTSSASRSSASGCSRRRPTGRSISPQGSRTSTTPSTTATTGRCCSPASRSSRSAWRSPCWPIACSRCSTGERTR